MKLTVTNNGGHSVHRYGFVFEPGETREVDVANRNQFIAIKAVRNLDVTVQDAAPAQKEPESKEAAPKKKPAQKKKAQKPKAE